MRYRSWITALGVAVLLAGIGVAALPEWLASRQVPEKAVPIATDARTRIGINLFGLANFNRQPVFANLIAQSEWFVSKGDGWNPMPRDRLDARGWVLRLAPGETAPRPLMLPPDAMRETRINCTYAGRGQITTGGLARIGHEEPGRIELILSPAIEEEAGAWLELVQTDPADPVRDIDCREPSIPAGERFQPEFMSYIKGFRILRFLDWQRVNDNAPVAWNARATPGDSSQVTAAGASIEDMVDLANRAGADPWFLMPYRADEGYIREFAKLVHDRIDPGRTVYVELGNEVWNDMFDAAQQAQREGVALGLNRDPRQAQAIRYAQVMRQTMRIWTDVFADRPDRLVRVAASQHGDPTLAETILGDADTARWVDALATAPYIWLELDGRGVHDVDWVFGQLPKSVDYTIGLAIRNRAVAARFGKRYLAYEGGQHLVTRDLPFARTVQRDPRMGEVYQRYLDEWNARVRSELVLYASTAPIGDYGAWGLREYAGQPSTQTPKLNTVRKALARYD